MNVSPVTKTEMKNKTKIKMKTKTKTSKHNYMLRAVLAQRLRRQKIPTSKTFIGFITFSPEAQQTCFFSVFQQKYKKIKVFLVFHE